ncbi:MAG: hypothetical protein J7K98_00095 [Candidatus Aenigmarchaeota archaeon]|nr:hypothetical protein [Candidatus Aenigmarchaeota archaeon]
MVFYEKHKKFTYYRVITMKTQSLKDIIKVSQVFASSKRLLLLFILKDEPMSYTGIANSFKRFGIAIGSSEIYKHLNHLLEEGFIAKKGKSYVLTLKGYKAVQHTIDIIKTPPTLPEVKLSFKDNE